MLVDPVLSSGEGKRSHCPQGTEIAGPAKKFQDVISLVLLCKNCNSYRAKW